MVQFWLVCRLPMRGSTWQILRQAARKTTMATCLHMWVTTYLILPVAKNVRCQNTLVFCALGLDLYWFIFSNQALNICSCGISGVEDGSWEKSSSQKFVQEKRFLTFPDILSGFQNNCYNCFLKGGKCMSGSFCWKSLCVVSLPPLIDNTVHQATQLFIILLKTKKLK